MRFSGHDVVRATSPTARAHALPAARHHGVQRLIRQGAALACSTALLVLAAFTASELRQRLLDLDDVVMPVVAPRSALDVLVDTTSVPLTLTVASERVPYRATAWEIRSDPTLWRRLQIADWNTVPEPFRSEGINAMLVRYDALILDPGAWDRMDALDWDAVPPSIRALAFRHMAEYWAGFYQVGRDFDLPRKLVADTLEAIVMSESWFDHRALNEAAWGNRDLGLVQASDRARERLRELYRDGRVDAAFSDEEYFNPWYATRFLAIWFDLLIEETRGDVDMAIRAYHRGIERANDEQGDSYLEGVLRRRRRFIRNTNAPPAWSYLWQRDRERQRRAWPWLFREP